MGLRWLLVGLVCCLGCDDEDVFLREIIKELHAEEKPQPIVWTRSTFEALENVAYYRMKGLTAVSTLVQEEKSIPRVEGSVPLLIINDLDAFCSLLRDFESIWFPYGVLWFSNGNNCVFGDEPYDYGRNFTIDERLAYCSAQLEQSVGRVTVLNWLMHQHVVAMWVNGRPFFSHWKLRSIPLGVGSTHYDIIMERHGASSLYEARSVESQNRYSWVVLE